MNTIYDGTFVLGDTNELTFSAGPGIKIDSPSAGTVRIGNDETVLWESSGAFLNPATELNEPGTNFEKIEFYWGATPGGQTQYYFNDIVRACDYLAFWHAAGGNNAWQQWARISANSDFSKIIMDKGKSFNFGGATTTTWSNPSISTGMPDSFYCYKIVGINRISGNA